MAQNAVRFEYHFSPPGWIGHNLQVLQNVCNLFRRKLVLPRRHKSRSSHRRSPSANNFLVIPRWTRPYLQVKALIQLCGPCLSVPAFSVTKRAIIFERDPPARQRLSCARLGRESHLLPPAARREQKRAAQRCAPGFPCSSAHHFTSTTMCICG